MKFPLKFIYIAKIGWKIMRSINFHQSSSVYTIRMLDFFSSDKMSVSCKSSTNCLNNSRCFETFSFTDDCNHKT